MSTLTFFTTLLCVSYIFICATHSFNVFKGEHLMETYDKEENTN